MKLGGMFRGGMAGSACSHRYWCCREGHGESVARQLQRYFGRDVTKAGMVKCGYLGTRAARGGHSLSHVQRENIVCTKLILLVSGAMSYLLRPKPDDAMPCHARVRPTAPPS